jgi:hypothetical protein
MIRRLSVSLALCVACGDDAASASGASDGSSGGATTSSSTGASDPTFPADGTTVSDDDTSGAVETGEPPGSTSDSTTTSSSSSDTGAEAEDPYALCASARSEVECEATAIEWTESINNPSCQWRDVYTVQITDDSCVLADAAPRCILFHGYLQGCGGGPACPGEDKIYVRDLGSTVEVHFYPYDDICGPTAHAPPDEPDWTDCGFPYHPACDCICGLI